MRGNLAIGGNHLCGNAGELRQLESGQISTGLLRLYIAVVIFGDGRAGIGERLGQARLGRQADCYRQQGSEQRVFADRFGGGGSDHD